MVATLGDHCSHLLLIIGIESPISIHLSFVISPTRQGSQQPGNVVQVYVLHRGAPSLEVKRVQFSVREHDRTCTGSRMNSNPLRWKNYRSCSIARFPLSECAAQVGFIRIRERSSTMRRADELSIAIGICCSLLLCVAGCTAGGKKELPEHAQFYATRFDEVLQIYRSS